MNNLPIPAELALAIPGSITFFTILLVVSFILHLVFVLVMIGGIIVALITEYLGIKYNDERYDRLAESTITITSVNKSIAVVLGVAPLLLLSTIYTPYIYSSTLIIAGSWMAIIPLVIVAFWFLYAYKFKWQKMKDNKFKHMLLGVGGAIPLLIVPLIFSTNMVLMIMPERWLETNSFWQAALNPTVIPRYIHVIFACFVLIGIMIMMVAYWKGKRANSTEDITFHQWSISYGAKWAMFAVAGQLVVGPVLLFLQSKQVFASFFGGGNTWMTVIAIILVISILKLLHLISQSLQSAISNNATDISIFTDNKFWKIVVILLCVLLLLMATIRHQVRVIHLEPYINYEQVMPGKTDDTLPLEPVEQTPVESTDDAADNDFNGADITAEIDGETLLNERCASCHALDTSIKPQSSNQWPDVVDRMLGYNAFILDDDERVILIEFLQANHSK